MRIVESYRAWYKFTVKTDEGKVLECVYPTTTELKRCVKPIFGSFEILDKEVLPSVVTQEMLDECPESAFVQAGNITWADNFYTRAVSKGYAYPVMIDTYRGYLVKDKAGFESCKDGLVINNIHYFKTKTEVGDKLRWEMDITVKENLKESTETESTVMNEGFTYGASKVAAENDDYCRIMARHDAERDVRIDSFLDFVAYAKDDGYQIGRADYEKYLKYYDEEKAKMSGNSGNVCPHCEQPVRGDEDVCPHCGFDNYGEGLAAAFE
jgi:hypothetical protein